MIKRIILIAFVIAVMVQPLFALPVKAAPADCYWVGGSGNWNDDDNHWATSSGGAPSDGNKPDSSSNVYFDENSDTAGAFTVTVNEQAYFADMDWSAVDVVPSLVTLGFGYTIHTTGSIIFASGMTVDMDSANIEFDITSSETLTTNDVEIEAGITISDAGTLTLQDDLTTSGTGSVYVSANGAELDTGGFDLNVETFNSSTSGSAITLNDSIIYCRTTAGTFLNVGSGATVDAGTSYIYNNSTATGGNVNGGGKTFYDVAILGRYTSISGENTFNQLTISTSDYADADCEIQDNQTITGTLTFDGYSDTSRLFVYTDTLHTQMTITAATVVASNTDFRDIVGAGAASWDLSGATGGSGDCGNNSGITFTSALDVYAVGLTGASNWSDSEKWASSSGGSGGSRRIPLAQDTAIFDDHSVLIPGVIVTLDMRLSSIDTTGVENNPTLTASTVYVYGSYFKVVDCTWTVTNTYFYATSYSSELSGTLTGNLYIDTYNNSLNTLEDDLSVSGTVYLISGVLDLNDFDLDCGVFNSSSVTTFARTLLMGSGDVTLDSTGTKWTVSATNFTLYSEDSTIIFTNNTATSCTFAGGGLVYNNLLIEGTGDYTTTITGTNTFNYLTVDRSDDAKTISGTVTSTINELSIPVQGTTFVTITNLDFTKTSGIVSSDYLDITGSAAGGGATYYAGDNSINGGGNSGWIFGSYAEPPEVEAREATLVRNTTATLNGYLSSLGGYSPVYVYFQYGKTTAYGTDTSEIESTVIGTKSLAISGLDTNDTYHFRTAVRYNVAEYVYSEDNTFYTSFIAEIDPFIVDQEQELIVSGDIPPEPSGLYDEGETGGLTIIGGELIDEGLVEADIKTELFWYPIAFAAAIIIGFAIYGKTRSLMFQAGASAVTMAVFCGSGALGTGLLPWWTVLVFIIEAIAIVIIQEKFAIG